MKRSYLTLPLVGLLVSCSSLQEFKTPLLLGAGGAALGSALFGDEPGAAAVGSLAGSAVGLGLNTYDDERREIAYQNGYNHARLEQVKRDYWKRKRAQANPSFGDPLIYRYVDIPVPGHFKDGVQVEPHTQTIEIVE